MKKQVERHLNEREFEVGEVSIYDATIYKQNSLKQQKMYN